MSNKVYKTLKKLKLERVEKGLPLFDMSMVNPDIAPKREIVDRLQEAILNKNVHKYSVARGINKLRQSFSNYYHSKFNVKVSSEDEVCLTLGAKDGLNLFLQSYCEKGDSVLVGTPTYPAFLSSIELFNLELKTFKLSPNFEDMLADIKEKLALFKPKVLLLNFPNNPTGIDIDSSFYKKLKEIILEHNKNNPICSVCNDFVYSRLVYDKNSASSLLEEFLQSEIPVIELYSLSKSYSLPGWRIAASVGSANVISKISELKSIVDYGIFLPLQIASSFILSSSEDYISDIKNTYSERANYLSKVLESHNFSVNTPKSACSIWAKIPKNHSSGEEYSYKLLKEHGIAVLPGVLFGSQFKDFVRFALVLPDSKLYKFNQEFK